MRWRFCGRRRERNEQRRSCFQVLSSFVSLVLERYRELFVGGGLCFGGRRGAGFGDGGIEHLVELGDVADLGVALLRDDEDGRGLGEADALAEGEVGVDLSGEEAVGIDDEGHHTTVRLEIFLGEGVEVVLGGDGGLVREDGAAIVLCELGRDLVLHVAGDDSRVKAPDVHLKREVVADEGDLVLFDSRVDDGEGASAGRALEVFELVDGDARASGGAEHRGVVKCGSGRGKGGQAGREGEQKGGEDDAVH